MMVCHFLGKKSDHPKKHCKYAQMLFKIAREKQTQTSWKKCPICEGFGHKSAKCPDIKTLKNNIAIQEKTNENSISKIH